MQHNLARPLEYDAALSVTDRHVKLRAACGYHWLQHERVHRHRTNILTAMQNERRGIYCFCLLEPVKVIADRFLKKPATLLHCPIRPATQTCRRDLSQETQSAVHVPPKYRPGSRLVLDYFRRM